VALFLLASASTLTIWNTDPIVDRIYECSVLSIAAWQFLCIPAGPTWRFGTALAALSLWGFAQLALGATIYRYATLQSALQLSALAATAWIAYSALDSAQRLQTFLTALAWFGFLASIVSVLAYFTSPGQILWMIEARYPDVWGPFLSRNNFAQFLELTLPSAFWLAFHRPSPLLYWAMAATMLAAGLASASRAGAIVLCLETLAIFLLTGRRNLKWVAGFAIAVALLAAGAGATTLLSRFQSDPLAERSEIYRSSVAMISARPWAGYGLGTFASVYPEFAVFDSGYSIEHAHNDWLEWSAEGGLGFAALWGVLLFPSLRYLRKQFWGLGIPAILLHALADFPMVRLGIAAWVFFLLGALEKTASRPFIRRTT
jgi:O-antigen ligase